ncbi:MAG: phage tail protein [Polyangiaceae bacterium]|nr:phage tail protein [Polyangiaceae bacterium]
MADSRDMQRSSYPLAAYNFRVNVSETSMSFTEVSGIAVDYEHVTYRHGLSYIEGESIKTFSFDSFVSITCKRGTVLGSNPLFLHEWLTKRDLRSMEVSLCDEKGAPVLGWKIAAAVPISLKAPTFSASTNEPVIETVELKARGISVVTL